MSKIILARLIPFQNTTSGWTGDDVVIPSGEFVVEIQDSPAAMKFKIGNGSDTYSVLPFQGGGGGGGNPVVAERIVCGQFLTPIIDGTTIPVADLIPSGATVLYVSLNKQELDEGDGSIYPATGSGDYKIESDALTVYGGLAVNDVIKVIYQQD